MARILVVEDERDLAQILEFNLRQAGHEVTVVGRGHDAVQKARAERPELILLDVMLPDLSGTEVLKLLRADARTKDARVIMVTAKGEEIDRVVGFELGADDYVTKPYSVRELLLRVQANLRRAPATGGADAGGADEAITFGVLKVDQGAHRVWVEGVELELTPIEYKLLVTLLTRRDRVQDRTRLLDDVWGIEAEVTTRTVDTHVKRLREKLGAAGDYVETVRGVGYRFRGQP